MRRKRILCSILLGMGCVVLLIDGLAWFLPTVPNRQIQLIVASFRTPSSNWLIQQMNNGMSFAMEHGFFMLLIGLELIASGVLLFISARADEQVKTHANPRSGKAVAMSATPASPVSPAATIRAAPAQPVEYNPFARYMKDGNLPKSTPAPAGLSSSEAATAVPDEAQDSRDDITNIWNKLREEPEDSDNLFIQPVHVENDEAYRRPDEVHQEPAPMNQPEHLLTDDGIPSLPLDETPVETSVSDPDSIPVTEPEPAPEPKPVTPAPAFDKPRPIIRSTFRKSAADQPAQSPATEIPAEIPSAPAYPPMKPLSESAMEATAHQAASRIKSTMGQKR